MQFIRYQLISVSSENLTRRDSLTIPYYSADKEKSLLGLYEENKGMDKDGRNYKEYEGKREGKRRSLVELRKVFIRDIGHLFLRPFH